MAVSTSSQCTIAIGPAVTSATDTAAEFAALSYQNISQIRDMGEFGDASNDVQAAHLGDGRALHNKGVFDAGTMTVVMSYDRTDTGQDALVAALSSTSNYAFRITLNDGVDPTTVYFRGQVMRYRIGVAGADNAIPATAEIGINSVLFTAESGEDEAIGADATLYTADITALTADYFGS
jgi:hypothetical protein